jgi:Virulence factor BrkB
VRAAPSPIRERLGQLWESGRTRESVDLAYRAVRRDMHTGGELLACALAMRLFIVLASRSTLRVLWTVHRLAWSEPASRPQRPWRGAWLVVTAILVLLAISMLAPVLRHTIGLGAGIAAIGLELALFTGSWLIVASVLPHGSAPWRALLPGAVVVAAGITLLHAVTTFWAAGVISHYNTAYGALGTAVALLLWFYAFGRLIVSGAMLNAARWEPQPTTPSA